jgi:hypothetical protein
MHKVAVAAILAGALLILSASSLTEVCHGRVLRHNEPASVKAPVESRKSLLRILLLEVLDVHVADHMVADCSKHESIQSARVAALLVETLDAVQVDACYVVRMAWKSKCQQGLVWSSHQMHLDEYAQPILFCNMLSTKS